tara:strand:+ start:552 stop:665 length:114 start_codon:yes stop_codon:yes gene_type:complete
MQVVVEQVVRLLVGQEALVVVALVALELRLERLELLI